MDVGAGPFELFLLIFWGNEDVCCHCSAVLSSLPSLSPQAAVSSCLQHGLAFSPAFPKHLPLYALAFFNFGKAARIYMKSLPVQGAFPERSFPSVRASQVLWKKCPQ